MRGKVKVRGEGVGGMKGEEGNMGGEKEGEKIEKKEKAKENERKFYLKTKLKNA